jgi:hypothetical protein
MLKSVTTPPSTAYFNPQNPPRHYELSGILGPRAQFRLEIFGDSICSETLGHLIEQLALIAGWLRKEEDQDFKAADTEVASWRSQQ